MRLDEDGRLRVLTEVSEFEQLACPAFAAIARYGSTDADVIRRLLEVMEDLLGQNKLSPAARDTIARLARSIRQESQDQLDSRFDKAAVRLAAGSGGSAP